MSRSAKFAASLTSPQQFGNFLVNEETCVMDFVHTVAEKCDCRRKRRDNGDSRRIRRQSPNLCDSRTFLLLLLNSVQ